MTFIFEVDSQKRASCFNIHSYYISFWLRYKRKMNMFKCNNKIIHNSSYYVCAKFARDKLYLWLIFLAINCSAYGFTKLYACFLISRIHITWFSFILWSDFYSFMSEAVLIRQVAYSPSRFKGTYPPVSPRFLPPAAPAKPSLILIPSSGYTYS